MSTPPPRRQHVVSQVLLRRWADPTGHVERFDVRYRDIRRVGPSAVFFVEDLARHAPVEIELAWKAVEDRVPPALAALDDGTLLEEPELVNVVKELLALHWGRSLTLKVMYEELLPSLIERSRTQMSSDPDIDQVFHDLFGIWPAGTEGRAIAADRVAGAMREAFDEGEFIEERLIANFEDARARVAELAIEVAEAHEGEFLIGDTPALSLAVGVDGVGPLGGVPWDRADSVVLPVGPRHLIGIGREPGWMLLDAAQVARLNVAQVAGAQERIVWRPGSGLRVEAEAALDAIAAKRDAIP